MSAGKERGWSRCGTSVVIGWLGSPEDTDVIHDGRRRSRESGQVAVLFALLLPVILILSVVVVDIGNWYVHKKHLQTLVDAGAFAGATKFVGCSFQFGDPVAANEAIKAAALRYSGDTVRDPATLNLQVQEPNDVRVVLNSAQYWTDGLPTDGVGLDYTFDHDNDPLTGGGDPCNSKTLDVKATDDDAPLIFGLFPLVVDPKSKARVEIRQIKEQIGNPALCRARDRSGGRGCDLRGREHRKRLRPPSF